MLSPRFSASAFVEHLPGIQRASDGVESVRREAAGIIEKEATEERMLGIFELERTWDSQDLRQQRRILITVQHRDETAVEFDGSADAHFIVPGQNAEDDVEAVPRLDQPVGLEWER